MTRALTGGLETGILEVGSLGGHGKFGGGFLTSVDTFERDGASVSPTGISLASCSAVVFKAPA